MDYPEVENRSLGHRESRLLIGDTARLERRIIRGLTRWYRGWKTAVAGRTLYMALPFLLLLLEGPVI